jgi:hypothetical protein
LNPMQISSSPHIPTLRPGRQIPFKWLVLSIRISSRISPNPCFLIPSHDAQTLVSWSKSWSESTLVANCSSRAGSPYAFELHWQWSINSRLKWWQPAGTNFRMSQACHDVTRPPWFACQINCAKYFKGNFI